MCSISREGVCVCVGRGGATHSSSSSSSLNLPIFHYTCLSDTDENLLMHLGYGATDTPSDTGLGLVDKHARTLLV